ncbi:hypothetical protein CYMTET_33182 [Cymbomonas tetramitiformis]|uniref:Ribosomal RNA-processing protein 8 n=1 Tax=Cymbomonas tetramitiformis TaxID=36881 RepID=A0AAE0FDG8_9CHLO|nr:hypothetical protein CYMTET_33182 [Cymbomonas tetramitiformis]
MESIMMDVPAFEGDSGSWDDVSASLVARPATAPEVEKGSSKKAIQVKAIKESVKNLGTKTKKRALESAGGDEEPSAPAKKQKKTALSTQSAARVAVPDETKRGGDEAKTSGKNLGKRRRANEKRMRIREERKAAAIAKQKEVKAGPNDSTGRTETSKKKIATKKTNVEGQMQSEDAAQSKTATKGKKNKFKEAVQGTQAGETLPKESPKKVQVLPAKQPAKAMKGPVQTEKAPAKTECGLEQPAQEDARGVISDSSAAPEPSAVAGRAKQTPKKQSGKVEEASPAPSVPESASRKKQGKPSVLDRLKSHLSGGHFRFLNEALYTQIGESSFEQFQAAPTLFDQYHDGFREQTKKWPTLPVHATRILVSSGWIWIAEVRSRLEANDGSGDATKAFVACLKKMGYALVKSDHSNKMFVVFQFQRQGAKNAEQPMSIQWPELKPCIYKRR